MGSAFAVIFHNMEEQQGGFFQQQMMDSGQIITTSADVTLNGGLIRELPQNPLNSGLGIILICPDGFHAI